MQIAFQHWVHEQPFSHEAKDLFSEGITCYGAGAFRAALLFSYLGFMTVLRSRILGATSPAGFVQGRWDTVQRDVSAEGTWDAAVFTAARQQNPSVFLISEDIRSQILYWKDRRNDCAHGKSNEISHSHVEAFWLFVRSNIARFVVNGSRTQLIQRLLNHFDRTITPSGASIAPIAADIPDAVERAELPLFFTEAEAAFATIPVVPFDGTPPEELDFYQHVLGTGNGPVIAALFDYLSTKEEKLVDLLRRVPQSVAHLAVRPQVVRRLWFDLLFRPWRGDIGIFCSMLATGIIPQDQEEEAVARAVERYADDVPDEVCLMILEQKGFFQALKSFAFERCNIDSFNWANRNTRIIVYYLERYGLDAVIVRCIRSTFDVHNHPYELRDGLNTFFRTHPAATARFREILEEEELPPPRFLESITRYAPQ